MKRKKETVQESTKKLKLDEKETFKQKFIQEWKSIMVESQSILDGKINFTKEILAPKIAEKVLDENDIRKLCKKLEIILDKVSCVNITAQNVFLKSPIFISKPNNAFDIKIDDILIKGEDAISKSVGKKKVCMKFLDEIIRLQPALSKIKNIIENKN
eukprot:gene8323-147_t